jgi:hypothetical protein
MDTDSAAMATHGEATKQKKLEAREKWVHIDAAGMTEQKWRGSVNLVNGNQNRSATQTTMTMETTGGSGKMSNALTSDANTTSTIHSISLLNESQIVC